MTFKHFFIFILVCSLPLRGWADTEEESPSLQAGGEVSGFTFVIPGKDGQKQSMVLGDTANLLPNGMIEVINAKVQVFRKGESDIFITSPKGYFNKMTREVSSDEKVQIQSQEMLIRGQGLFWDPKTNKASIHKKANVKIFSKPQGLNL